jgi:hypothetical protein
MSLRLLLQQLQQQAKAQQQLAAAAAAQEEQAAALQLMTNNAAAAAAAAGSSSGSGSRGSSRRVSRANSPLLGAPGAPEGGRRSSQDSSGAQAQGGVYLGPSVCCTFLGRVGLWLGSLP